jgi:hypothetical protein
VPIEPGAVIHHPACDTFPEHCPDEGVRGDRNGYSGVQLKVWCNETGAPETAIYRPDDLEQERYVGFLSLILHQLLEFRGEPERVHRKEPFAVDTDRFHVLDTGADPDGAWGPGLLADGGEREPLDELTEAAVYAVRMELMS